MKGPPQVSRNVGVSDHDNCRNGVKAIVSEAAAMTRSALVRELSIGPQEKLIKAIEQITRAQYKILLVTDADGRLLGVLTDYDIRQAILNRSALDVSIGDVIGHNPVVAQVGASDSDIVALIQSTRCLQIPVLDADGRPVDIRFKDEFVQLRERSDDRVAVVMAGGLGTRLRPMTEHVPKPLLDVGGRPILFILLDQLISEGFNKIYVTLFYKSDMIADRIQDTARYRNLVDVLIESEPLGTGGSLSLLPSRPAEPFLLINADLLTEVPLRDMLEFHRRQRNVVTLALKRESFAVPYGVAEVKDGQIVALREKPEISLDVSTGVYIVAPSVLDRVRPGVRFDMPQMINELLADGQRVGSFPVHEFWLDVGTHRQYNEAQIRFTGGAPVER